MIKRSYWQDNLRLVGRCLAIWFMVSFGFGILWVDALNQIEIGGFRLGFWFAQQGSIYVFVLLIFFYAWRMSVVDARHAQHHRSQLNKGLDEGANGGNESS